MSLDPNERVRAKIGDFGLAQSVAPDLKEKLCSFLWSENL